MKSGIEHFKDYLAILRLARSVKRYISSEEVRIELQCSKQQAQHRLRDLVKEGYLEMGSSDKSGYKWTGVEL